MYPKTRIVALAICSNCRSEVTELIVSTTLCVACRAAKLGKSQRRMLEFAQKYLSDGQLQSLGTDKETQHVAWSLHHRGLIYINPFNQFTLKRK